MQQLPVNFSNIRKAIVDAVQKTTGLTCIRSEPSTSDAPRPALPYFSYKITSPGIQHGDANIGYSSGTEFSYSTQMEMVVSFQCYAVDQDDSYSYLHLWQQSLNTYSTMEKLRQNGLAVWDIGTVADL